MTGRLSSPVAAFLAPTVVTLTHTVSPGRTPAAAAPPLEPESFLGAHVFARRPPLVRALGGRFARGSKRFSASLQGGWASDSAAAARRRGSNSGLGSHGNADGRGIVSDSNDSTSAIPNGHTNRNNAGGGSNSSSAATARTHANLAALTPPPTDRLQRAALAMLVLHLPAVALLVLRAVAAPATPPPFSLSLVALNPTPFPFLSHPFFLPFLLPLPSHERLLSIALVVISPELLRVVFDNFRACAIFARRARQRPQQNRAREALYSTVKFHYALTVVVAAAQLAGLYTATIFPAPGCLATVLCTGLFYVVRRVRFEPGRLGRAHRVEPGEYRDVITACCSAALLIIGVLAGFHPLALSVTTLAISIVYWLCKWTFVSR